MITHRGLAAEAVCARAAGADRGLLAGVGCEASTTGVDLALQVQWGALCGLSQANCYGNCRRRAPQLSLPQQPHANVGSTSACRTKTTHLGLATEAVRASATGAGCGLLAGIC